MYIEIKTYELKDIAWGCLCMGIFYKYLIIRFSQSQVVYCTMLYLLYYNFATN
jgi:hypothetical protein